MTVVVNSQRYKEEDPGVEVPLIGYFKQELAGVVGSPTHIGVPCTLPFSLPASAQLFPAQAIHLSPLVSVFLL